MNTNLCVKELTDPTNLYSQVDAVCYLLLRDDDNVAYYNALGSLPNRVKATMEKLFMSKINDGYHASVIRAALVRYNTIGTIDINDSIFSDEELDS